jgi:cytochrome c biogenesis protein CcdA/glutaredoxin-related protein
MNKKLFTITISFFLFVAVNLTYAQELHKLIIFFSPTCHRCVVIKEKALPKIEKEFKGKVEIEYRDVTDLNNYKYFLTLKDKYKVNFEFYLPVFFMDGNFMNGKGDAHSNLRKLITFSLGQAGVKEEGIMVDLIERFKRFTPLAIVGAGLTDGINPCAFTVIVFFISFLALQGYRRRELAAIGITFIFAVFLTYLLLGLGLFNFLYALKGFWVVIRIINLSIAVLSIALGIAALYDLYKFKKTGQTEGMLLQLPGVVKNRIHSVIGEHYRKTKGTGSEAARPHIFRFVLAAFTTGFLVSLLEAVCTGQLYVPTIAFILKTTPFKLWAFGYLLLYNLMFVIPLFIIFLFALLGTTSEEFSEFLKKHMGLIKIAMAAIFFGLGIFLIWRP